MALVTRSSTHVKNKTARRAQRADAVAYAFIAYVR
jgi:hypothetical protein